MTEQAHDRPKVGPTQQPMAPCDLPVPRRSRRPAWTKFIDEPIEVHQRADETSRTPNKACYWIASAMIDGEQFIARSRYGAVNELARQLVAAGIPDAPMFVYTAGLRGFATIPSFHRAANWTYEESAGVPLHRIPYARRAAARERARSIGVEAPKQGVSGPGGVPQLRTFQCQKSSITPLPRPHPPYSAPFRPPRKEPKWPSGQRTGRRCNRRECGRHQAMIGDRVICSQSRAAPRSR